MDHDGTGTPGTKRIFTWGFSGPARSLAQIAGDYSVKLLLDALLSVVIAASLPVLIGFYIAHEATKK